MALSTVGEDLSFITVSTHDIPTSNLAYHILFLEDGDRYMTTNTIDLLFFRCITNGCGLWCEAAAAAGRVVRFTTAWAVTCQLPSSFLLNHIAQKNCTTTHSNLKSYFLVYTIGEAKILENLSYYLVAINQIRFEGLSK